MMSDYKRVLFIFLALPFLHLIKPVFSEENKQIKIESSHYTNALNELGIDKESIHFPVNIPKSAKVIHFKYFPGALQSSPFLVLHIKTSKEYYKKEKSWFPSYGIEVKESFYKRCCKAIFPKGLPKDYKVFLSHYSIDRKTNEEYFHGIAFHKTKNELIYFFNN